MEFHVRIDRIRLNWKKFWVTVSLTAAINSSVDPQQLQNSGNDASYERLEFLGDRVLGLIIAELLLDEFPDSAEGKLAPRLASLVSGRTSRT